MIFGSMAGELVRGLTNKTYFQQQHAHADIDIRVLRSDIKHGAEHGFGFGLQRITAPVAR